MKRDVTFSRSGPPSVLPGNQGKSDRFTSLPPRPPPPKTNADEILGSLPVPRPTTLPEMPSRRLGPPSTEVPLAAVLPEKEEAREGRDYKRLVGVLVAAGLSSTAAVALVGAITGDAPLPGPLAHLRFLIRGAQADQFEQGSLLGEKSVMLRPGQTLVDLVMTEHRMHDNPVTVADIVRANGLPNPNQVDANVLLTVPILEPNPTGGAEHQVHVVSSGESLDRIASRYGTSTQAIVTLNRLGDLESLTEGMRLTIPHALETIPDDAYTTTYDVQRSDTLQTVARRMGVTPERLAEVNELQIGPDAPLAGVETLEIPVDRGAIPVTRYVVDEGDSLDRIAASHGVTIEALRDHNPAIPSSGNLIVGQTLRIPPPTLTMDAVVYPFRATQYYVARPGDTVLNLAERYRVPPQAIVEANAGTLTLDSQLMPRQRISMPLELYRAHEGDSVYGLSRAFGVAPSTLAAANPHLVGAGGLTIEGGDLVNVPLGPRPVPDVLPAPTNVDPADALQVPVLRETLEARRPTEQYTMGPGENLVVLQERFGIELVDILEANEALLDGLDLDALEGVSLVLPLRTYRVDAGDTLASIAEDNFTTVDRLQAVNPGTTRAVPFQEIYIPLNTTGLYYYSLPQGLYVVQPDDTFDSLSARFETNEVDLRRSNRGIIARDADPAPGQTIHVPLRRHTMQEGETLDGIARAYDVPLPDLERLNPEGGRSAGDEIFIAPSVRAHRVDAGETLEGIAVELGVPVDEIRAVNQGLEELVPGRSINVPTHYDAAPAAGGGDPVAPPTSVWQGETSRYQIKQGDTLFRIALCYGVSIDDIMSANVGVIEDPNLIYIGHWIDVPRYPNQLAAPAQGQPVYSPNGALQVGSRYTAPVSGQNDTGAAVGSVLDGSRPAQGQPVQERDAELAALFDGATYVLELARAPAETTGVEYAMALERLAYQLDAAGVSGEPTRSYADNVAAASGVVIVREGETREALAQRLRGAPYNLTSAEISALLGEEAYLPSFAMLQTEGQPGDGLRAPTLLDLDVGGYDIQLQQLLETLSRESG